MPIPVIDLFAGPGGLAEGFASLGRENGSPRFRTALSIEKDPIAHQTLELRAFYRQFPHGEAPEEYYEHLRGRLSRTALFTTWPVAACDARESPVSPRLKEERFSCIATAKALLFKSRRNGRTKALQLSAYRLLPSSTPLNSTATCAAR